jgi:hypothetical protein
VEVLNACANLGALEDVKLVHVIQSGCNFDNFVENNLVEMYTKCGILEDPWRVYNEMSS